MTTKKQNIFTFSLIVAFMQFCYIFVALIGSGYFFATKTITISAFILLLYLALHLYCEVKNESLFKFSSKKILTLILSAFFGFYIVKILWFYGYLNLEPIKTLFEGKFHIDTLYHTAIAESIKTDGFPSIQINEPTFLKYHTISHFILAVVSKVFALPCLITYNFLYPIIFVPLFIFLVQKVVLDYRKIKNENAKFSTFDVLFLYCFFVFFLTVEIASVVSMYNTSFYTSESCFASICLLLFSLIAILKCKNVYFKKISVAIFIITPISIFLISGAKISTGFIFLFFCCYYFFRDNPLKIKNWIPIIIYLFTFFIAFYIFSDAFGTGSDGKLELLSFAKKYICSSSLIPVHYSVHLFIPCVAFIFGVKDKVLTNEYFLNKSNYIYEATLLATIISFLPGIFLVIGGGSAYYFVIPAFFISVLVFLILDFPNRFFNLCNKKVKVAIYISVIVLLTIPNFIYSDANHTIRHTVNQSNENVWKPEISKKDKIKAYFSKSEMLDNKLYQNYTELYSIINKNKKDYCIFVKDDCAMYDLYKNDAEVPWYGIKYCFALSSYFGVPIINAIYKNEETLYTANNIDIGDANQVLYYGVNSVNIPNERLTESNAPSFAKKLNKKHIIVLSKDSYTIIDLN